MEALTTAATAATVYAGKKIDKALDEPIKRLSRHFCDVCKEKKILFNINKELKSEDFLRDYIIKSYNEVSKVRNLLYQDNYQLVEESCIFTDLTYKETPNNIRTIKTNKIQNILDLSHKIIITGFGGMGKTIMMKFLHINCIKQLTRVPVFITLRNVPATDGKVSIFNSVKDSLTQYGAKMSDALIEASLQKGCYLLLFDGFDEIKSDISGTIANEIMKFSRKYDNNYFIVSSRPSDEFISWSDFKVLHTEPLSPEQALALIDKLAFDDETKNNFKNELVSKFYYKHEEFASNPLLLTIMFLVYSYNGFIPEDFCDFYDEAFRVMFYKHDKTKNYKREIHSKLSESQLQNLFTYFCFKTFFKQQYSFKENELIAFIEASIKKTNTNAEPYAVLKDLSQNLCMFVKEGLEYKFVHRSFQEYFAAVYTKNLTDSEQKKLLSAFIEKAPSIVRVSEYFPILVKLDGERFYKNVIVDMLDEIEAIYNSVDQDDYEFLLKLLSNYEYGQHVNGGAMIHTINFSTYETLFDLMSFYTEDHIVYDLPDRLLSNRLLFNYSEKGTEILNENGSEYHYGHGKIFQVLNAAEFINIFCAQTGEKDEIMKPFQPYIDKIKSWFRNRLYQESCIDDLLDDM